MGAFLHRQPEPSDVPRLEAHSPARTCYNEGRGKHNRVTASQSQRKTNYDYCSRSHD